MKNSYENEYISFQDDKHLHSENQKWKLPPNGQPICLFSGNPTQTRTIIRADDDSEYNILCDSMSNIQPLKERSH